MKKIIQIFMLVILFLVFVSCSNSEGEVIEVDENDALEVLNSALQGTKNLNQGTINLIDVQGDITYQVTTKYDISEEYINYGLYLFYGELDPSNVQTELILTEHNNLYRLYVQSDIGMTYTDYPKDNLQYVFDEISSNGLLYRSDAGYGDYIEYLFDESKMRIIESTKQNGVYTLEAIQIGTGSEYKVIFTDEIITFFREEYDNGYSEFTITDSYEVIDFDTSDYTIGNDRNHTYWFGYGW